MLNHDLVLKSDELYLAGETLTDGSGERAAGLYLRDTRHLSECALTLNGTALRCLSARTTGPASAIVVLTNDLLRVDGEDVLPHTVAVEERVTLGAELQVDVIVRNFAGRALSLGLDLELAADFRDLFDIRGAPRSERGQLAPVEVRDDHLSLGYEGLDGLRVSTTVAYDQPMTWAAHALGGGDHASVGPLPDAKDVTTQPGPPPLVTIQFPFDLPPNAAWALHLVVTPVPATDQPIAVPAVYSGDDIQRPATVSTDNALFDRYLARCDSDLAMLQTSFPEGSLPAAGIPWFVAPFGRDSLIVGLQTFHVYPDRAAATLRVLAALQGTKEDPPREEEPGKILHEMRYGEMARTGEIPHTPYYGTVDATPLFIMLFAETTAWTGDRELYDALLPHVRRALAWIEEYGDVDGDGLVEYSTEAAGVGHISNKVWKDSHDSLHYRDGRRATGQIAAVEVQGYVYAAYAKLSAVAARMGDTGWATELREQADRTRRLVEDQFWMDEDGFYAQALDGDKRQVDAVSSNPGHLLFCGLPAPERAARVAQRLGAPDLNSGWGIRTLSAEMPAYNPMSYHNGSVWPHDNSLIIAGLREYGHTDLALQLIGDLFHVSLADPLQRLPELYCGFERAGAFTDAPVDYPVSCRPQAWAAAAGHLFLRSMLGLCVDDAGQRVLVDPVFPDWLTTMTPANLTALGQPFFTQRAANRIRLFR